MRHLKKLAFFIILFSILLATSGYTNVIKEKTFYIGDTKNTIAILCIDKHKFVQTIVFGPNGNISVSLVQVYDSTHTGGKPASCYDSDISS